MSAPRPRLVRGYTLVELMITVAVLGIAVVIADTAGRQSELRGLVELERERATLLLEYEADCVSRGRTPDPAVITRLTAALPDARIDSTSEAGTTTLTVSWRPPGVHPAPGRPETRSLTVFTGSAP